MAKSEGLIDIGCSEPSGTTLQPRLGGGQETVAVAIALDHQH